MHHRQIAERLLESGNPAAAIEQLRKALGQDVDDAFAHALLALCLRDTNRLFAADYEARQALRLAPEMPTAHYVAGLVALRRRELRAAERHLNDARALDPEFVPLYRALAQVFDETGRSRQAEAMLREGLRLAPEDPDLLADLGMYRLDAGKLADAEGLAREALASDPECAMGNVLMGHILLRSGDSTGAREHALMVLRSDARFRPALNLLCQVKARTNPLLGLWWRYAVWMARFSDTRAMIIIVGSYVAYRLAALLLEENGYVEATNLLTILWLIICAYSWTGGGVFQKMLDKELKAVRLRTDF